MKSTHSILIVVLLAFLSGCRQSPEEAAKHTAANYLSHNNFSAALQTVDLYLQHNPSSQTMQVLRLVILLQAEQYGDAERYLKTLPAEHHARYIQALLDESEGAVRAGALHLIVNLRIHIPIQRFIAATDDPHPDVRRWAGVALGQTKSPHAVRPLFRLLQDDNWHVRAEAAKAFAVMREPRAVGWLMQLAGEADAYVRECVIHALAELTTDQTRPLLVAGLQQRSTGHRTGVAAALALTGDPRALPALVAATHLRRTEDRLTAAEYLAVFDAPEAAVALRQLAADSNEKVRAAAARSLKRIETRKESRNFPAPPFDIPL
jgi:HEAT repeat protein